MERMFGLPRPLHRSEPLRRRSPHAAQKVAKFTRPYRHSKRRDKVLLSRQAGDRPVKERRDCQHQGGRGLGTDDMVSTCELTKPP
jgi:hypothetical protein